MMMKFEINDKQVKQIKEWKDTLPKIPTGVTGDGYTYCFGYTSVGDVVTVKRFDGHEIDITEYDNF
jgi:hypothetical protein